MLPIVEFIVKSKKSESTRGISDSVCTYQTPVVSQPTSNMYPKLRERKTERVKPPKGGMKRHQHKRYLRHEIKKLCLSDVEKVMSNSTRRTMSDPGQEFDLWSFHYPLTGSR